MCMPSILQLNLVERSDNCDYFYFHDLKLAEFKVTLLPVAIECFEDNAVMVAS